VTEEGITVRSVRAWVGETAGGLPRQFWYLWANILINRIGSFVVLLMALYLTQVRGLSATFAGLVIGLWGAGSAVGTLLGGVLADRWGRKRTMLTGLYGGAAVLLLLGLARGGATIAVTIMVLGMVGESARPAASAMMVDIVGERDRLRAFSLQYWAINVGFSVAALTAGLVAGISFTLVFALDAATTVAAATLVALRVHEPTRRSVRPAAHRVAGTGTAETGAPAGFRTVLTDRVFLGFVGLNLLVALVFMQHISMLPITMVRDGLSARTFGSVIALNGVLIVVGQLFVPRLLRLVPRSWALASAALVMGIGFGLTAFAHTAWFYAVTVLVWTIGEMLNAPSSSASLAELSPADLRGRYQGVFGVSWSIASFLAPILGGAVLEHLGRTVLWMGVFGLGVLIAGLNLLAAPSRARRAAVVAARGESPPQPAVSAGVVPRDPPVARSANSQVSGSSAPATADRSTTTPDRSMTAVG
jgi:MFS family permease